MIARLLPHPLLSLLLALVWLLLSNGLSVGTLVLAALIGLVLPVMTAAYWPGRARIRSPLRLLAYILLVLRDIVVANVQVALIVLFKPNRAIRSAWVTVPLEITSPEAITFLAGTITMTPGTLTALLSADAGSLLVHCLHTDDPEAVAADIKQRYEARLKEIFA